MAKKYTPRKNSRKLIEVPSIKAPNGDATADNDILDQDFYTKHPKVKKPMWPPVDTSGGEEVF